MDRDSSPARVIAHLGAGSRALDGVPLAREHEAAIEPALARIRASLGREAPSELAFANLYLFRHAHAYHYLPGPLPCVAGITYDGVRHLLPLFDVTQMSASQLLGRLEGYDCYFPIARSQLSQFAPDEFDWDALRADSDYLYPAINFQEYRGERLRKKRNLMRQLQERCTIQAHPLTRERVADAEHVLDRWMGDKSKSPGEADEAACAEALTLLHEFGLACTIYYIDGAPVGFLIGQEALPGLCVIRFAKGVSAQNGIYPYMFHEFSVRSAASVQWLNFEQDLGLANFRQTKRSFDPSALIEKFRVRRRLLTHDIDSIT